MQQTSVGKLESIRMIVIVSVVPTSIVAVAMKTKKTMTKRSRPSGRLSVFSLYGRAACLQATLPKPICRERI